MDNKTMLIVLGAGVLIAGGAAYLVFSQKPAINYNYIGNNGTVTGDEYCRGPWGNDGKGDKNMSCIGGITDRDPRGDAYKGKTVKCDQAMANVAGGMGHWKYACK
eukprot:TRINITY_DN2474_c0_g2_i2.p3 TRINITY_DN2474_c0_g2~~TRINITY_DN2474_c0_g2_i2.p3  ORF type:complete len:105 (-),score=10.66 TRINITY_DN2474_c0_g2_i2:133-447(-)